MTDILREQARLIEATVSSINLYQGCQHVLDDAMCDVMCDAYVRGDGMIAFEPNYEAAGKAIWNSIQGDGSVTWETEDKTIKKQYVEWGYLAVDAALGEPT